MIHNPICVFDSGLGSMSIIRELRRELPQENLVYFADKAHFPYGTKGHQELLDIIINTIRYLERYKPKLILMASITPSVYLTDEIEKKTTIPLIGVRPPLQEACRISKKKHIAIMATQSTINSKAFAEQIRKQVPQHILVTKINASPIIQLVEDGTYITNEHRTFEVISNLFGDELDKQIDVIALSSTHLPFVKRYIATLVPTMKIVDPSNVTSREVRKLLVSNRMLRKSGTGKLHMIVSRDKRQFEQIIRRMGLNEPVQKISIDF